MKDSGFFKICCLLLILDYPLLTISILLGRIIAVVLEFVEKV